MKTRLCKKGPDHASDKTCNFAHSLVELRMVPRETAKDWNGFILSDRWIGQVVTDQQIKEIFSNYASKV